MCLLFDDETTNAPERHAYKDFELLAFDYPLYQYGGMGARFEEDLAKYQAWYAINVDLSIDSLRRRKMLGGLARNMAEALSMLDELPLCDWRLPERKTKFDWPVAEPKRRRSVDGWSADATRGVIAKLEEKKRERFERERLARTLKRYDDSSRACSPSSFVESAQRPTRRYFDDGREDLAREDACFDGQAQQPIWLAELMLNELHEVDETILNEEEREDDMQGERPDLRAYEVIEEDWTPPRPAYSPITPPSIVVETAEKTLKRKRRLFASACKSTEAQRLKILRYPTRDWTPDKHDEHCARLEELLGREYARGEELAEAEKELEGAKLSATIDYTAIAEAEQWDNGANEMRDDD